LRGLGFLLRRIKWDSVLKVNGCRVLMSGDVSYCYGRLVGGQWNEPETHIFLHRLVDELGPNSTFIDVGANIGEMVIDLSRNENFAACYAFEPIPECAEAIRKSLAFNGVSNTKVIQKLCGRSSGRIPFVVSRDASNSSVFSPDEALDSQLFDMTSIDAEIQSPPGSVILLIDVEGYEIEVLQGASDLLELAKPIIIFEFNHVSKKHFSLLDMQSLLGANYEIWRLRKDGLLDKKMDSTWNCVAFEKSHASILSAFTTSGKP